MNKLTTIIITITALLGIQNMNAQNCGGLEIKLDKHIKAENYDAAYPVLNEALANCPKAKINFYNFGEIILENKIEASVSETEKKKYAQELVNLIDMRIQNFPNEKKAFWEGEKINYQLDFGLTDQMGAYQSYKKLFNSSEDIQKLSSTTVINYYIAALELMNADKLSFEEAVDVYFETKEVAEANIELRSIEYGQLAEKRDSLKNINPKYKLTPAEEQTMANAQTSKDLFIHINESMEGALSQYTTCDNIAPMFESKFEANKDSIEWLAGSYQALASKDCYDTPIMKKLEERYAALWKEKNPQAQPTQMASQGGVSSCYGDGARMFKAGNYSSAISKFKCALDEVSGTRKGDVAYYIALSYQKTNSLSNAVSWAKKAANYKPGWGAPYQLIASAFGSSANACGSSQFEKLATYWVAADYANKACAVDSRSCSWARSAARSYEGNAPSTELAFSAGKKKGDRVSINCLGGASTRVR